MDKLPFDPEKSHFEREKLIESLCLPEAAAVDDGEDDLVQISIVLVVAV